MTDKPATTYIVSVFEKPHWRTPARYAERMRVTMATVHQALSDEHRAPH